MDEDVIAEREIQRELVGQLSCLISALHHNKKSLRGHWYIFWNMNILVREKTTREGASAEMNRHRPFTIEMIEKSKIIALVINKISYSYNVVAAAANGVEEGKHDGHDDEDPENDLKQRHRTG